MRYFQLRNRLKNAIEMVVELSAENGMASERITEVGTLPAAFDDPFLFVVVGEAGAGKSALLNALFGGGSDKAEFEPGSGRIEFLQYAAEAKESDCSGDIVEVFRPIPILKDFHLLNLQGAMALGSAYHDVAEQFLPRAELILVVFSVKNPWGDSTWEFLDRIHRQWNRKIVLVLQQCELRTGEEVAAILEHVKKTAFRRFGQQFPIFTVSAKMALLAKSAASEEAEGYRESVIDPLRQHLSRFVESSIPRLVTLIHACPAVRDALGEIKARLDVASMSIHADDKILSKLESIARNQAKQTLEKQEALFEDLYRSIVSVGEHAGNLLEAEFRFAAILLPRRRRIARIEERLSGITMKLVRRSVKSGVGIVTEDVDNLWASVSDELQEGFHLKASSSESGRPNWDTARRRFSESVLDSTSGLPGMNLLQELESLFRRRRPLMWGCLAAAILSGLAGVTLTILHRGLPGDLMAMLVELVVGVVFMMLERGPLILLPFALAVVLFIAAMRVASRSVKQARTAYNSLLDRYWERIAKAQRDAFREQTIAFHRDFVAEFKTLRKICEGHRLSYGPGMRKFERAESSLAEVERVLQPVVTALNAE